ncbi:MAG TPA: cysteine desulfurase, partial [Bacteroidia bacterium]|nr:cysteine desulfurase [Bacteroidia bacterium]
IHRGVHYLSQIASQAYDDVRIKTQKFLGAAQASEIVFVRGTTEAVNLVAATYGRQQLKAGDEILISHMEHHSNIVPWQILAQQTGAVLKVIPINKNGELDMQAFYVLCTAKTKIVSVTYVSNALGTINPVKEIIDNAHKQGAVVLIDGAQAVSHFDLDVQELNCDFFACSAHKMLGPTGIGVLYGKHHLLTQMPPYMGGGDMIQSVSFNGTTYNEVPYKFEAGTPHIEGVIAWGAALDYWQTINRAQAMQHEQSLLNYCTNQLQQIKRVKIIGTAANKCSVCSFVIEGVSNFDAGMFLDTMGIAVRTGQHCTEPLMDALGVKGTIRASFFFYNTIAEVDKLIAAVKKCIDVLAK